MKKFDEILNDAGFRLENGNWGYEGQFNQRILGVLRGMYENMVSCLSTEEEESEERNIAVKRILSTDIKDLDVSVRLINCLRSVEMETLGDALSVRRSELLKIRHLGSGSLRQLDRIVYNCGLKYGKLSLRDFYIRKTMN